MSPGGESDEATTLSGEHRDPARVRRVYDEIASHFSQTRATAWPEVVDYVADAPAVARALDLGCGNGRNAELLADRADRVYALDASRGLLLEARERARNRGWTAAFVMADAMGLPLATGTIDLAVYIATLHHLPTRKARRASLNDLARVLVPGGRALVSVWSTTHDRFDAATDAAMGFDTTVDWTLPDGSTVPRFYHIYAPAEFEADVRASRLEVESFDVASGNCYAAVRG